MDFTEIIQKSFSYREYRTLVDELLLQNKTTGSLQSEQYTEFTKLNVQRMNRIDKQMQDMDVFESILERKGNKITLLVIGDAWCGDCAQIIPVLNYICETIETNVELRIISKDTFPDLIEKFSTNGSKSIPKVLFINSKLNEVIDMWGPRPTSAQNIMYNWKANQDKITKEEFNKELHLWYAKNKGREIIKEVTELIVKLTSKQIA